MNVARAYRLLGLLMLTCENCGEEFDPIASRWLCPACRHKAHCCEGEAQ